MSKQQQSKRNRIKKLSGRDFKNERIKSMVIPVNYGKNKCHATDKVQYTMYEAEQRLYNIMLVNEVHGVELRTEKNMYQCPSCNAWHLTSKTGQYTNIIKEKLK